MRSELITYDGRQLPAPKFATQRDPSAPTLGTRRRAFSQTWLRRDFMPWQQLVSDVAGELRPDGLPRYGLVVCTVQRQAGKSHLSMAKSGERCFSHAGWRSWYTAQTGGDARDQFLKFDEENVGGTPLRRFVTTLRGNGHEAMRFANRSTIRPHPPTETALHGKQSDENDIDEGWAFDKAEGDQLLQAIGPTQLTRPAAQTWVWSAGGTVNSTWLAELVDRGRAGDPGMAYFEWAIPDDLDLGDLEAIASYHPAVGHTITLESLQKLRALLPDDGEFARAAGNRWTDAIGAAIDAELWQAGRWQPPIPDDVPVAFGAARAIDGSEVAIAAAAKVDGHVVAEVLDVVPAYGAELAVASWTGGQAVAIDRLGPSASLADACQRNGQKLVDQGAQDAAAAVATFLDALAARAYKFRPNAQLDAAVRVAGTRRTGDGGVAWARVKSGASIAALEAVTKACWAITHKPAAQGVPVARHSAA